MTSEIPDDYPNHCSICGDTLNWTPHTTYPNPVCDNAIAGPYRNREYRHERETIRSS